MIHAWHTDFTQALTAAATTTSQQLWHLDRALVPTRTGTKYPVRGVTPHSDKTYAIVNWDRKNDLMKIPGY